MLVRDAMKHRAETIGPDETLQAAAARMKALNIGALPVCENGRIIGMLTDRDIVIRGVASGMHPAQVTVRASMTPRVVSCLEEQPLYEAAALMEEHCIRRIMVLDSSQRLVGFLSLDDLAISAGALAADVIEKCIDPGRRLYRGHWQHIA
jgi:CBS domain-containing protein